MPGATAEGADEIGEVGEAGFIGDIGDGPVATGQEIGGAAQAGADQILVRRHPEDAGEEPEKVEGAQARHRRRAVQSDGLIGMGIDPQSGLDGAAAVARAGLDGTAPGAAGDIREPRGEQQARLVEAEVAAPFGRRLGQLAQNHELGQRRYGARRTGAGALRQGSIELERQALVAASMMLVAAHVLFAGMADEHRPRHQLERLAPRAIAEAAPPDIGQREAAVLFRKWLVAGTGIAAIVDDGNRRAVKESGSGHGETPA